MDLHPEDIGLVPYEYVGDVNELETAAKTVVAAINELKASGGNGNNDNNGNNAQFYLHGENNSVLGADNIIHGNNNTVIGSGNIIVGDNHFVIGSGKVITLKNDVTAVSGDHNFSQKSLITYGDISDISIGDIFILQTTTVFFNSEYQTYNALSGYFPASVVSKENNQKIFFDRLDIPGHSGVPAGYDNIIAELCEVITVLSDDFKIQGNKILQLGGESSGKASLALNMGITGGSYSFSANYGKAYSQNGTALNSGYCYSYGGFAANYGYTFGRAVKCAAFNYSGRYLTAESNEDVSTLAGSKIFIRLTNSSGSSIYTYTVTVSSVSGQNIYWTDTIGSSTYTLVSDGLVYRIEDNYGANMAHGRSYAGCSYSRAGGCYTAAAHEGAEICGRYGSSPEPYSWSLANGTKHSLHGLAAKILQNGNIYADGTFSSPAADYAEFFEWADGNPENEDRAGLFVTLDGDKIRLASDFEEFVLGVVSAAPAVIGDTGELHWSGKFLTDNFGRVLYEPVTVPAEYDKYNEDGTPAENASIIKEETVENQPVINPDWDSLQEYIPRSKRKEWAAVGVIGKLRVRDDGTCEAGDLCRPSNCGIATKSIQNGYRVLKRISENIILIWVR